MIRVIHHLADAPAALRQVRRSLAAGATFVLEFANKRHLKAIARYVLGRQAWNAWNPQPVEFAPPQLRLPPTLDAGRGPRRRL